MENRLLNEIRNIVKEYFSINEFTEPYKFDEFTEALYELQETAANEYYNTMKINKEEEGTTARFNHWAINHFKK